MNDEPLTAGEALTDLWVTRIRAARKAKQPFADIAEVCWSFYRKSAKFMWEDKFLKEWIGNIPGKPQFEVTMNKAWEYVAVLGPYLIWDYPHRRVKPYQRMELNPQQFEGDQELYYLLDQLAPIEEIKHSRATSRAVVMERVLNYTAREQSPGLDRASLMATVEAMVKGRGVLVPRTYTNPGSERMLTGLFWESVDDLFIDPDCSDPFLRTAKWIAIRHQSTNEELEDMWELPRGTLDGHGHAENVESMIENHSASDDLDRVQGRTNNITVWYEIWSKCGIGDRRNRTDVVNRVESMVGDYCYLAIATGVPWPLNAPPEAFHDVENEDFEDEMLERYGWPFPVYEDGQWPVALLDFALDSESPWPVAPLSASLGHLMAMNVLLACVTESAYENRKQIILTLEQYAKEVKKALSQSGSPAVVSIKADMEAQIDKFVTFINRPSMNQDPLLALEYISREFEKSSGLVPFLYGNESKVSRSARDVAAKEEHTSIRPEKMAKDVAAWQTRAATLEGFLAAIELEGTDVEPHVPAQLWDFLISSQDPELVFREMDCVVEATDVRRPNRERDLQNLQTLSQQAMQVFLQFAESNGDWEPMNNFLDSMFKSMEQPFTGMRMEPGEPDPMVQQQQQLEMQKLQMESAKLQADAESRQMDAAEKQADMEADAVESELRLREQQQGMQLEAAAKTQGMLFDRADHQLDMMQSREKFIQEREQAEAEGQQKIRLMRAQAAAKPKTNGSAK